MDLLVSADTGIVDFKVSEEEPPEEFKKLVVAMTGALKEGRSHGEHEECPVIAPPYKNAPSGRERRSFPVGLF
jgi:hypothetical protein